MGQSVMIVVFALLELALLVLVFLVAYTWLDRKQMVKVRSNCRRYFGERIPTDVSQWLNAWWDNACVDDVIKVTSGFAGLLRNVDITLFRPNDEIKVLMNLLYCEKSDSINIDEDLPVDVFFHCVSPCVETSVPAHVGMQAITRCRTLDDLVRAVASLKTPHRPVQG